jgi:20S proteasome alpha/beta subunit
MGSIILERSSSVKHYFRPSEKKLGYSFPPKPPVFPKPKRLPERKPVTIAAGFRCSEGIVLCADTEETIGDIKQWTGKITTTWYQGAKYVVCFAGAGFTDYIHTAIEKAREGLGECNGLGEIRARLEANLLDFFDKHLSSWAYFAAHERPSAELLIGVATKAAEYELFYYGGTAFYQTSEKTIGSGVILANNLISEYSLLTYNLEQLCRLGVLVLSKVKRQVVGCGGDTCIVALRKDGAVAFIDDDEVRALEAEMNEKQSALNSGFKDVIRSCGKVSFDWLNTKKDSTASSPSAQ